MEQFLHHCTWISSWSQKVLSLFCFCNFPSLLSSCVSGMVESQYLSMVLSEREGCGLSPVPLQCPVRMIYGGVPFEPNDEQCLQKFMSCNCFILVQSIYSLMLICSHMVCCVHRVVRVGFHQIWGQDQSCNARIQAQYTLVKRALKFLVFSVGFSL
jgi:hypothetical protein